MLDLRSALWTGFPIADRVKDLGFCNFEGSDRLARQTNGTGTADCGGRCFGDVTCFAIAKGSCPAASPGRGAYRAWAKMNYRACGQADAIANLMRRTEMQTWAPILRSVSLIVPHVGPLEWL